MFRAAALCFVLFFVALPLGAGELTLSGVVLDPSGASIADAEAVLAAGGRERRTDAEADGSFVFEGLEPGAYELRIAAPRFSPYVETWELTESITGLTVLLALERQSDSVAVTADADAGPPDPAANADRVEIDQDDLQRLPALDGDVIAALQGFLDGESFGGDGGGLVVDGMETSELGVTPSAIQEVRINKDPYSAEYSRPGRARIEVITKKGAQETHGQLNLRLRDYRFDARNAFSDARPEQRRFAAEGSVVGPLGRGGKNSYVVSAEHDRDREGATIFAATPNGVVRDAVVSPETETELSVRWDRHASYERAFSLRYEYERESERNDGVGGFTLLEAASDGRQAEHGVYGSYRRILGASSLFEWNGRLERESERETSRTSAPRLVVKDAFTAGGAQVDGRGREVRAESSAVWSRQLGRHYLRTGLQLRELAHRRSVERDNFGGTYRFATLADFEAGRPFAYSVREGDPELAYWDLEAAVFLQDNVKLNERSTLALGVRYDRQNFGSDPNNVAPRASLAVGLGAERRTTVRVGGGLFYDNVDSGSYRDRLRFDGVRLRDILLRNPLYPEPLLGDDDSPAPNVVRWSPSLRTPYVAQYNAQVERRLSGDATLSVNWVRTVGVGLLRSRDLNAPAAAELGRPKPEVGIERQLESSARMEANAVSAQLRGKLGEVFNGMIRYTWGRAYNNVEDGDALPANSLDLSREWGPADFDRRHRFDALGAFDVMDWFDVGVVLEVDSARPYALRTGQDDNGDGIAADRPAGIGRNTERGAASTELDVRLSKRFSGPRLPGGGEEPTRLTLTLDAFNVLNTVNLRGFVGNLSSPLFGRPTGAGSARRLQAGLRWGF